MLTTNLISEGIREKVPFSIAIISSQSKYHATITVGGERKVAKSHKQSKFDVKIIARGTGEVEISYKDS